MNDGTRPVARPYIDGALFMAQHRASLVVVEGHATGAEYELTRESQVIGRDAGADITLNDDALSGRHASVELGTEGFQIRDLGSTNGTFVNGSAVVALDLKHGAMIRVGDHTLQYVVENT